MDKTEFKTKALLDICMDLPQDEKFKNDMTNSGKFCPNDNHELEKVSNEERHTCHWCGGIFIIDEKGTIKEVWFKGFE